MAWWRRQIELRGFLGLLAALALTYAGVMAIPFGLALGVGSGGEVPRSARIIAPPPVVSAPIAVVPSDAFATSQPGTESSAAVAPEAGDVSQAVAPSFAERVAAQAANVCEEGEPRFALELVELKRHLGGAMGDPLECEQTNPENGDVLQQTTTGLAFYRASTNTPVFTDGYTNRALMWGAVLPWSVTSLPSQSEAGTMPMTDPEPTAVSVPASEQYWTVSVVTHLNTASGERLAQLSVRHLESRGLPAEVLPSAYHMTVRPGLLVVSSGRFDSSGATSSHLALLRSIGFADAYPTHVMYRTAP